MTSLEQRIRMALGAMAEVGPRELRLFLKHPAPDVDPSTPAQIDDMIDLMLSADPEDPNRLRFADVLRGWDNENRWEWAQDTRRNSAERRAHIHTLLKSDPVLQARIDTTLPFYDLEEPIIIGSKHQDWYAPVGGVRDYYWSEYTRYLRQTRKWKDEAVINIDNSTRAIIECLSNPESREAYASRGLVMGYVQSGKTANFMGVAARAADAGYRLIIVLAGTWNILRNQTQRRFDKELLGKELLQNDPSYVRSPPPDWPDFLEHGIDLVQRGHYLWQRLTRPDIDFKSLKQAIDSLEYERVNKAAPIYDPRNLHYLPVKLLVIKKHPGIIGNLVRDLKLLHATKLHQLPTLIIDDESDQAGLNTLDRKKNNNGKKLRTKTNERIADLLNLFPRGQYVGYTATPYANALVDPDDPEDLFPRDFIVSLDRPKGYMGVRDFFDPNTDYDDLDKQDFSLPEIAYIRRVSEPTDADDADLKKALRSYVIAGGVKLYRRSVEPDRYRAEHFKHHTMLVHTSRLTGEHQSQAQRLKLLWDQCAFNSPAGLKQLKELWDTDLARVASVAQPRETIPTDFETLIPHLGEAIRRVERGPQPFLVLNSDRDSSQAPDFSEAPVWKIIIGGDKLSRGYTIEGLTVSYYRRVAGTADTLMQMGRWFGFRPGYQDLVRVFLGVKEGPKGQVDLVAEFKGVCRMEESFRDELQRYVRRQGEERITPIQIPPLISVSGNLPPTAGNKMFNARLTSRNFGGRWSQLTLAPAKDGMDANREALNGLLRDSRSLGRLQLGGTTSGKSFPALVFESTNAQMIRFLEQYHWLESRFEYPKRPTDAQLQIEFLRHQKHGIRAWLIVAPQRKVSFGTALDLEGTQLAVKERQRTEVGGGFQVFGEPLHRRPAEFLADIENGKSELTTVTTQTADLRDRHRGIMLLYPVREKKEEQRVTIGYELLFPKNDLAYDTHVTVIRKGEGAQILRED